MDKISAALVKAQKAFGPALKDKNNPAFRSKYADLGACIDAVMDALNGAGIALIQKQHANEGGVAVETIFLHESGEQMSAGILNVPATKQDAQGYGSALTYARRYSLMAACCIAPEDDDGNAASRKQEPAPRQEQGFDPRKIAAAIEIAVASGKAAEEAAKLSLTEKRRLDAIWAHLSPETADKLTEHWPE